MSLIRVPGDAGFVWSAEEAGGRSGPHTAFAEQCAVASGVTAVDTQCQGRGCEDCSGDCGWCSGPSGAGLCSTICSTTPGECAAVMGHDGRGGGGGRGGSGRGGGGH